MYFGRIVEDWRCDFVPDAQSKNCESDWWSDCCCTSAWLCNNLPLCTLNSLCENLTACLNSDHFPKKTHVALCIYLDIYSAELTSVQIVPQEQLDFHKCYDVFECAKLSVPLDYFTETYPNETVSIALVKLPAKVPVDDPRYGGPILLNPGGPGGPGAWFALLIAQNLRVVVDSGSDPRTAPDDAKFFDLIGFDPRGIGLTEPQATCMPDQASSWSWAQRENEEGVIGSSDATLGRLWSMTQAYGASCKQITDAEDGPDIKEYMSTAIVARDMLEIAEKHAEYVAKTVTHLTAQKAGRRAGCHNTGYTPGEAKVQYWGFSYGTFLGSTFASMFPDRVGRLLLDGVVSSYDYTHALGNGSLTDNEKAMESFYTFCHHAGPSECALAKENGTIVEIKERFQGILESLYHNPLPINSPHGPEVLTWSDMKLTIFSSLYQPRLVFPIISELLAAVEAGGGAPLEELARVYHSTHVYSCPVNGSVPDRTLDDPYNIAMQAILCGDSVDQSHVDKDDFAAYWQTMDSTFPTAGSTWSILKMRCAAWKLKASYNFAGPFGGKTSHPILFISNTADPVTPLRSGRIMHGLFPGSGLLVGDGAGHCSIAIPSICTLLHIRAYFQTGALPPLGAVCVPPPSPFSLNSTDPKSPFYDPSLGTANVVTLPHDVPDIAHRDLHDASLELQRAVGESDVFGFQGMLASTKAKNVLKIAAAGRL